MKYQSLRDVKARLNRSRRKRRLHRRRRRSARVRGILRSIYAEGLYADFSSRSPIFAMFDTDSRGPRQKFAIKR